MPYLRGSHDPQNNRVVCQNRFIVIFFTLAAIIGAIYSIKNMPLDAIPDLSIRRSSYIHGGTAALISSKTR